MTSSLAARAAVMMDKVLTDPALFREFHRVQRELLTPAAIDQAEAANRDALRLMLDRLGNIGGAAATVPVQEVADWARLGLIAALMEWIAGEASTCLHSPHPARAQPVLAAAWRPGLVACAQCVHLFAIRQGAAEDRTCDCCGRITAGLDVGDGIHPCRLQLAAMVYMFGACRDCHPRVPGGIAA